MNTNPVMAFMSNNIKDINKNEIIDVDINDLREYQGLNHKNTFKINDKKVKEIAASILEFGILNPIIVRPDPEGITKYEILAGHHRYLASKEINYKNIPCIIKNVTDIEANQIMVTSNRQRESLLISEKAFMYKYEYEAIKMQGKRTNKKIDSKQIIADMYEESRTQIGRYIRICNLIEELLELIDSKKISLQIGADISFLKNVEQVSLFSLIEIEKYKITPIIAIALKDASKNSKEELTIDEIKKIIEQNMDEEENVKKVSFTFKEKDILDCFPPEINTKEKREIVIIKLLEKYKDEILELV